MEIFGIPVIVERELGSWIVRDEQVNMYGVGATEADAIEDYKSVIWEYLVELQQSENILGKSLRGHLAYLRELL